MTFPSAPLNFEQERIGVSAVAHALAKLGLIWRETPMADVGIDGQVEFVSSEGKATGRLIAAQIKSGPSYLNNHETHWHYYPAEKHRLYWERFPLPVLLFLHNPEDDVTYWCDARQWLRSPKSSKEKYIAVPKNQKLQSASKNNLFETTGAEADVFLDLNEVLEAMLATQCTNASFPVSYFELFAFGLTNICRTLYFDMDVALHVAEFNLEAADAPTGVGVGETEHEFLFSYTQFIISQHLANIDFSDCLIDWIDRQMQPGFCAPLTRRGRELVALIHAKEETLRAAGRFTAHTVGVHVAQEGLIGMQITPGTLMRFPLVSEFVSACRNKNATGVS
jgi:hypothetical protein